MVTEPSADPCIGPQSAALGATSEDAGSRLPAGAPQRRTLSLFTLTAISLLFFVMVLLSTVGARLPNRFSANIALLAAVHAVEVQRDANHADPSNTKALPAAEPLLRESLVDYPDDTLLWRMLGTLLTLQGRAEEAAAAFDRSADGAEYFFQNVRTAYRDRNFPITLAWLAVAADTDPAQAAEIYQRLAREYRTAGDKLMQTHMTANAMSLGSGTTDNWYRIGQLYAQLGEHELAIEAWEKGLDGIPGETVGRSNLYYMIASTRQNRLTPPDPEGAWQAYQAAVDADDYGIIADQRLPTYYARGQLLAQQRDWDSAIQEYRKALELDGDHYRTLVSLADAYRVIGEFRQSEQSLLLALESDPSRVGAYRGLGRLHEVTGDINAACNAFGKVLAISPQDDLANNRFEMLACPSPSN